MKVGLRAELLSSAELTSNSHDLNPKSLGQRLRSEREREGVSQDRLGRRLGSSGSTIRGIELANAARNPRVKTVMGIADYLGLTDSQVLHALRLRKQLRVSEEEQLDARLRVLLQAARDLDHRDLERLTQAAKAWAREPYRQ